jgi:hypothetical protein
MIKNHIPVKVPAGTVSTGMALMSSGRQQIPV